MTVWDTAGVSEYAAFLRPHSCAGADAVALCAAVDAPDQFGEKAMERWKEELDRLCPGAPILLVGEFVPGL